MTSSRCTWDTVRAVRERVSVRLAVKVGPHFTAFAHMASRLAHAGALVLFNRFYQPDFDLERLEVAPHLVPSSPHEALERANYVRVLQSWRPDPTRLQD
jgi:dihydroorotate dehydrogenase (fumarate)